MHGICVWLLGSKLCLINCFIPNQSSMGTSFVRIYSFIIVDYHVSARPLNLYGIISTLRFSSMFIFLKNQSNFASQLKHFLHTTHENFEDPSQFYIIRYKLRYDNVSLAATIEWSIRPIIVNYLVNARPLSLYATISTLHFSSMFIFSKINRIPQAN